MTGFIEEYRTDVLQAFRSQKKLAEGAIEQVSDDEYFRAIDEESNSMAALVKHIGGNMRSRWTDFLTSDGEKPDRDRDSEFVCHGDARESLEALWEKGWSVVLKSIASLQAADFTRNVRIRGEELSVVQAITRSLNHTAYHVGQIVFLAKHFRRTDWKSLSIPRGGSSEFNAHLALATSRSSASEAALDTTESK